jgi:t-SNARE complex subunit (syntaxin)
MDFLLQKVSYLQGLAEGLGLDEATKEGKILLQIIETLGDFADVLDDVIDDQIDLEEYVNFIDEDLADVEDDIYGEDDDDDDDFDFEDYLECCDDDECECHSDEE